MRKLTLYFDEEIIQAVGRLSVREKRPARDQIVYIVKRELEYLGYLPTPTATPTPPTAPAERPQ